MKLSRGSGGGGGFQIYGLYIKAPGALLLETRAGDSCKTIRCFDFWYLNHI